MSIDVAVYGSFICTCNQPLKQFVPVSAQSPRTLKCTNPACPNFNVAYQPPAITLQLAP